MTTTNLNQARMAPSGANCESPVASGVLPNRLAYSHPHPDPSHVMRIYRRHLLGWKRRHGTARGLIHYRAILAEYLAAKRTVLLRGAQ